MPCVCHAETRRLVVDTISFKTLGRRKLSDEEYEGASKKVLAFLAGHDFITNREFRALTHLSYDQAVSFFNRMIAARRPPSGRQNHRHQVSAPRDGVIVHSVLPVTRVLLLGGQQLCRAGFRAISSDRLTYSGPQLRCTYGLRRSMRRPHRPDASTGRSELNRYRYFFEVCFECDLGHMGVPLAYSGTKFRYETGLPSSPAIRISAWTPMLSRQPSNVNTTTSSQRFRWSMLSNASCKQQAPI